MKQEAPSYKWLVVGMLWAVCFFNYADRQAIFSVFPLIKHEFALSDVELGVVGSSFMWMYAITGLLAGWLCDRLPRKSLVLGALLFWSVVTFATALSRGYWDLVLWRTLGGLGEAFYFPASMSLLSDFHRESRSRAMSIHQSSVYAGTVAGGAISGLLGQYYGWKSTFMVFGAGGFLLSILLWPLLREPERGMAEPAGSFGQLETRRDLLGSLTELLSDRMVRLLIGVFMCANFVAVVFLTWMPSFLHEKFRMSLSMAGFSATAYLQIASVVGVLSGGILADSIVRSRWKRHSGGRMFVQALGLLCGVPFLALTGWSVQVVFLICAMTGFGFFKGIYDANIFASLHDVVPVHQRGIAVGIMNSAGWLGGGVAPIGIALAARKYGMSNSISATAGIYLLTGILMLRGAMRKSTAKSNRTWPQNPKV